MVNWKLAFSCWDSFNGYFYYHCYFEKAKVIKTDSAYSLVLEKLPSIIQSAESAFGSGNGDKKLSFVLELSFKLYESLTGSMSREEFSLSVSPVIESILSTPKKK